MYCIVLYCFLRTASLKKKIKALYVASPNPFKEVEDFIKEAVPRYNLELIRIDGEIRSALFQLKKVWSEALLYVVSRAATFAAYSSQHSHCIALLLPPDPSPAPPT